jgi:Domain of unknown function (DUF3786)
MVGLIDQADGGKWRPGQVVDQARQAWQESMSRPIDELARSVRQRNPADIARRAGCEFDGQSLHLSYWNETVLLPWPELAPARVGDGKLYSTFDQAMLLYYLDCADGAPPGGRWIGFRELPNGAFYHQAYQGYSGDRLAQTFGLRPGAFDHAARTLAGETIADLGTAAFGFWPLPRIQLAAVLWPGDEEFAARGAVLFDAACSHYMTTDGLALLGGGLAGRLGRAAPST